MPIEVPCARLIARTESRKLLVDAWLELGADGHATRKAVHRSAMRQKALGIDRGHAACAGRRDRLSIDRVSNVAASKNAGDAGFRAAF